MGLFLLLTFVCVALGETLVLRGHDQDDSWNVLVKYKVKEQRYPHFMVADPKPYFVDVPAFKFFQTVQDALAWLGSENKSEQDIYGVYTLTPYETARVHAGTRRVTRNVPTDVEEPVFEWVQQSAE